MDKACFDGLLAEDLNRADESKKVLAAFLGVGPYVVANWTNSNKRDKPSEKQLDRIAVFLRSKGVPFPDERLNRYRACFDYPQLTEAVLPQEGSSPAGFQLTEAAAVAVLPDTPPVDFSSTTVAVQRPVNRFGAWRLAAAVGLVLLAVVLSNLYLDLWGARVIQSWDFEQDHGQWGAHLTGRLPIPGTGVARSCQSDLKAPSGSCSLEVPLSDEEAADLYAAAAMSEEANSANQITARVAWSSGTASCTPPPVRCATAKLIVWDNNNRTSYESNDVQLVPGDWLELQMAIDEDWVRPLQHVGIHVYRPMGLRGSVHVDAVTISR